MNITTKLSTNACSDHLAALRRFFTHNEESTRMLYAIGNELQRLQTENEALKKSAEPKGQKPSRLGEEGVDLIARGMTWNDTEALMKEACAQAGIKWGENDEPSSLAINVMQRLANAAHKVGFTLGVERMRAAKTPAAEERAIRELLCIAYAGALAYMDDGEAQDNSVNPGIDFIRDSAAEINRKMRERAAARVEIHKANWDKPANG